MKIFLVGFLCLFFSSGISGQTTEKMETTVVNVENIALMRDDGKGTPGVETEIFKTTDSPIHFQIQLDSFTSVTVKMILAAAEAKGLKPETKILTINYKTDGEQNIINFRGSPKTVWLAGKYRVDIFVDNKLAGTKEFEIEKSTSLPAKQTNFAPPKANPKTKPKRKN